METLDACISAENVVQGSHSFMKTRFKDFFKHHLFYIKHLSNSHASICSVMKDLTVLNIFLTLNIYIKTFRVMF